MDACISIAVIHHMSTPVIYFLVFEPLSLAFSGVFSYEGFFPSNSAEFYLYFSIVTELLKISLNRKEEYKQWMS